MKFLPQPQKISRTDTNVAQGLAHGFEMAGVVVIFSLTGLALDLWLDTKPIFILVMSVLGVGGLLARAWFDFSTKVDEMQTQRMTPSRQSVDDRS